MLYKFKSRVAADLIMLEPNGRRILQIIGKDPDAAKGVVLPQQMAAAISALEAAVALETAQLAREAGPRDEQDPPALHALPISLRQRAKPFLDMLRRCERADEEIVWGV